MIGRNARLLHGRVFRRFINVEAFTAPAEVTDANVRKCGEQVAEVVHSLMLGHPLKIVFPCERLPPREVTEVALQLQEEIA
jgi:hypothetical protein